CRHPSNRYLKAHQLLNAMEDKWQHQKTMKNTRHPENMRTSEAADLDSRITTDGTLADIFRIFTEGYANN
ncbi:hypothetical protein DFH08DRAFT_619336, partial [Mycena albidolilacea]